MEAFGDALRQARDKLKVADYSMAKVFPMTKDPSVIRSIVVNLHDAQVRALDALLLFERAYKRVPAYPVGHLETKLRLYSEYCVKRYGLSEEIVQQIREVKDWAGIAREHVPTVSPNGRILFRVEGFQIVAITLASIRSMLHATSSFIERIEEVLSRAGSA